MWGTGEVVKMPLALYETLDLVIEVNCDPFAAAKQLEEVGLEVDTVLKNTKCVFGRCVPVFKSAIESCECVVTCEVNE